MRSGHACSAPGEPAPRDASWERLRLGWRDGVHDFEPSPLPCPRTTSRAKPPSPRSSSRWSRPPAPTPAPRRRKNTNRAYAADWRDYLRWRARQGLDLKPLADPECVGLYLAALASGAKGAGGRPRTVGTIERRLSALVWNFAQRALPFDRKDRHVATVLAGVRRTHGRPPVQKEALLPEHVVAMLDALPPSNLRNIRDRAILLLGFAGGLRRSEVAGLVMSPEDSLEGSGWPEFFDDGVLLTLRGKTGWREVEIGRGSSDADLPGRRARDVAEIRAHRARADLPRRGRARGRIEGAQRPSCRAPGQTPRGRRRRARRSLRGRSGGEVFRAFAARRARLLGRDRRALRPEAPGPRVGGNDPPLPAPPRPLSGQSDQGGGAVSAGIAVHAEPPALPHDRRQSAGPIRFRSRVFELVDNSPTVVILSNMKAELLLRERHLIAEDCVRRIPDLARAERGIGFGARL